MTLKGTQKIYKFKKIIWRLNNFRSIPKYIYKLPHWFQILKFWNKRRNYIIKRSSETRSNPNVESIIQKSILQAYSGNTILDRYATQPKKRDTRGGGNINPITAPELEKPIVVVDFQVFSTWNKKKGEKKVVEEQFPALPDYYANSSRTSSRAGMCIETNESWTIVWGRLKKRGGGEKNHTSRLWECGVFFLRSRAENVFINAWFWCHNTFYFNSWNGVFCPSEKKLVRFFMVSFYSRFILSNRWNTKIEIKNTKLLLKKFLS